MNYLIVHVTKNESIFARFQKRRGTLVFLDASRNPLDSEHSLPALLAERGGRREDETIVLSLPPGLLFLREIDLPISDRRKIREVLPLELKGETAVDTDDLVFDGLPLEDGKVLAVWVKRKDVAESIRIMTEARMEPEFVTASLFHWQRLLPAEDSGVVAITDGEAVAVYRDGRPLFFRPLTEGEFLVEVKKTLTALEIGKGVQVEKVFLHGGAARGYADYSSAAAPADIRFIPLPIAGEPAETFGDDHAAALDLAGAYAAARATLSGDPVNFRSGNLSYTAGRDLARRKFRLSMALAAVFVLFLFGEAGLRYFLVKRDLDSLNASIRTIYREVFPNRKKPVDEVGELRSEIKRLGGGAATGNTLAALKQIAEMKGDDVTGIYEAEVEGGQVRLKGDARSIQAVNDFKARAGVMYTGAEVAEIKSRPDGSVSFVFRGTLKGGEK